MGSPRIYWNEVVFKVVLAAVGVYPKTETGLAVLVMVYPASSADTIDLWFTHSLPLICLLLNPIARAL